MSSKNVTTSNPLLFAADAGNGTCQVISTETLTGTNGKATYTVVGFEPVIAPYARGRALDKADEKPIFSLREDEQILVFGVSDVAAHGNLELARRLSSDARQDNPDYRRLIYVLLLKAFAAWRGNNVYLAPTGCLSVPVSVYNDEALVEALRDSLVGKHEISDYEGCTLRVDIQDKRLLILPESYGIMMSYAYDLKTRQRRAEADTSGTTLVLDLGYETANVSLYEGLKYQRQTNRTFTIERAGMGVIARAIRDLAKDAKLNFDVSRIDRALQRCADFDPARPDAPIVPGQKKLIEPIPGMSVDVTLVYASKVREIAQVIGNTIETTVREPISRIVLGGGGTYHLTPALKEYFAGLPVVAVQKPEDGNVVGMFTQLLIKALSR